MVSPGSAYLALDLGKVCDIAEVKVNGKPVGVSWAPPYRLDVTADLHPGLSKNETDVTDEWTNRQIGDRTLPENQRVLVPSGVLPDQPGGGGAFGRAQILHESGLLGDVRLIAIRQQ
jgi:hypothetical protein